MKLKQSVSKLRQVDVLTGQEAYIWQFASGFRYDQMELRWHDFSDFVQSYERISANKTKLRRNDQTLAFITK